MRVSLLKVVPMTQELNTISAFVDTVLLVFLLTYLLEVCALSLVSGQEFKALNPMLLFSVFTDLFFAFLSLVKSEVEFQVV